MSTPAFIIFRLIFFGVGRHPVFVELGAGGNDTLVYHEVHGVLHERVGSDDRPPARVHGKYERVLAGHHQLDKIIVESESSLIFRLKKCVNFRL